jgi:endoglucanase
MAVGFAIGLLTLLLLVAGMPLAFGQGTGYWHTSGSQIVDASGKTVRITGINWYGFETTDQVVHGLYAQDYKTILNTIHAEGFNTIRLPFSNQMVEKPIVPSAVGSWNNVGQINTDLAGLNSLQIMDKIVAAAGQVGLKVILVNHRSEAGNSNEPNGLWYTTDYPEAKWIADWQMLATRYKSVTDVAGNPVVIGVDLRNEPHLLSATGARTGSCWTGDTWTSGCPVTSAQNWPAAAGRAAKAVLTVNSGLLIAVEGTDCYSGDCGWQGANLEGAAKYPVVLPVAGRLVYSAHDYGPDLHQQAWFSGTTTATSLKTAWTKYWAYLSINGIAPVWLGEFGTTNNGSEQVNNTPGSQGQWFSALVSFLANEPAIDWTYWALNGEDEFGLLDNGYDAVPASAQKEQLLASIQFRLGAVSAPACGAVAGVPAGVAAMAGSTSAIAVKWSAVAAPANCSVTYSVFRSTVSGFTPAAANQVASALTAAGFTDSSLAASTAYYYRVEAVDAKGASAGSAQVTAKTLALPVCGAVAAVPTGLTATAGAAIAGSGSAIALKWGAVAAPANCSVSYSVFRSTVSGFTPAAANQVGSGLTGLSFADSGLTASTPYYYRVEAVDAKGASAAAAQVSAKTAAAQVAGVGCHVTYSITNSWAGGFQGAVSIQNTGSAVINGWTLVWTFANGQSVTGFWNGAETQSGKVVTASNMSWNGTIAPGATVTGMGFTANAGAVNAVPVSFTVNGAVCR